MLQTTALLVMTEGTCILDVEHDAEFLTVVYDRSDWDGEEAIIEAARHRTCDWCAEHQVATPPHLTVRYSLASYAVPLDDLATHAPGRSAGHT